MTTDRTAILEAAVARRATRIREGVKLGVDGQAETKTRRAARPVKGAKTPKAPKVAKPKADKVERTPRATMTDKALGALIVGLYKANPKATASSMIGLVRAAGHSCNGARIRATFVTVTGVTKRTTAKAESGDTAAAEQAAKARFDRTAAAKAETKTVKAWEKAGSVGARPETPVLDEMRKEYEAKQRPKAEPVTVGTIDPDGATVTPLVTPLVEATVTPLVEATVTPITKTPRKRAAKAATTGPRTVTPITKKGTKPTS